MLKLCRINVRRPHPLTFRANDIVIAGDRDHAMKMKVGHRRIYSIYDYDVMIKFLSGERYFRIRRLF